MFAKRFLPVLLVAAIACIDSPTSFGALGYLDDERDALESIPGIVVAPDLLRSGDRMIRMYGYPTFFLRDLIGAEILAEGRFDVDEGDLYLSDIVVLAVDGIPVLDGELRWSVDGYSVATRAGELPIHAEVPEALADNVGRRVWVAVHEGECVRYGVLDL
jgi:hypothetical protein